MADATTPLGETIDAFDRARGEESDGVWALRVCFALMTRDVREDLVREELDRVLELVRETDESPEQLFGPAREHAEEVCTRWCAEGRAMWSLEGVGSARDVVVAGLLMSAVVAGGAWLVGLLGGGSSWTTAHLLVPLVGLGAVGGLMLWDRISRGRATPVAVVGMVAATLAFSGAVGSLIMLTRDMQPVADAGAWLLPVEAAVLWAAGTALGRHSVARATGDSAGRLTDDEWSLRLAGILRGPGWRSDARARELVAEARAHAAESGRSVAEEFGAPEDYAAQLGPHRARRRRLVRGALLVVAGLATVLFLDEPSWRGLVLVALLCCMAWLESRR